MGSVADSIVLTEFTDLHVLTVVDNASVERLNSAKDILEKELAAGTPVLRALKVSGISDLTRGKDSTHEFRVLIDLLERAADVHLKEGRPLVICPRETPWNLVHLRNLTALAEAGARIAPPVPAWYHQPTTIEDMVDFLVIRVFDALGDTLAPLRRWTGPIQP